MLKNCHCKALSLLRSNNTMINKSTIQAFSNAPARMVSSINYTGYSAQEVFDIMGDPERITDWYLLAHSVKKHPPGEDGLETFNVVFTFFGDVFEEILEWSPPEKYIYKATGPDFPIKDYFAEIKLIETGENSGTMTWTTYFDQIDGEAYRRILPVILPAVTEKSIIKLMELIGGTSYEFSSNFDGITGK